MAKEEIYEGYLLRASVRKLPDGKWNTCVLIRRELPNDTLEKIYTATDTWTSENEAEKHSLNYGKQIVDGEAANASLEF